MDNSSVNYCNMLLNKIFGSSIEKYFKIVNVSIIIILMTVLHYIYSFDEKSTYYNDNILLRMYYGFLFCLIGFAISINWIYYEYIKNKKSKKNKNDQQLETKDSKKKD
ncbi:succinate dehydrogenase subunit 4, putative [Plasmodium gallinaceum]|uniref:Succinate dehydrogenase subunit 4, putative n=1 Tax=Plasmodium gallinaceum TaxID=5849 RepID=A0A1J1GNX7_PLAGA|nr:succinate dehydrogenase subunit 4, putative [Plasmodium gallinaceum]CRG94162.1 succinate dehydrogenase subunit 4, putative [Plasmodium gallinaceum]